MRILFTLIIVLISSCQSKSSTAEQFVRRLYDNYKDPMFNFKGKSASAIFDEKLLYWIRLDEKNAQGEVGYLDSDPLCSCQDAEGLILKSVNVNTQGEIIVAKIILAIGNKKINLDLSLLNNKGKWLIYDISSKNTTSLLKYMEKSLKNVNLKSISK